MLPRRLKIAYPRTRPYLFLILLSCCCGCAAMVQDVHLYYQQMAINYKEAEEKAKLDAVSLERESASLLQGGELHKYNRAQRELARVKNWQEYCSRQQVRFQKAADKTAKSADGKASTGQSNEAIQETEHKPD